MTAASWPDEGSLQNVHLGLSVTSPMPLCVWSVPAVENVSRRNSCVTNSRSTLSVILTETNVVPSASSLYWLGAAVSGLIPSEMASIRINTPPGSIRSEEHTSELQSLR